RHGRRISRADGPLSERKSGPVSGRGKGLPAKERTRSVKIWAVSDLHREFERFRDDVPRPYPEHDVVVLAGDIDQPPAYGMRWIRETFGNSPVVYVAGNHEFYGGVMVDDIRDARRAAKE